MSKYDVDRAFAQIVEEFENEQEQIKKNDFVPEARPIPDGLITEKGHLPLGHIVYIGDFEQ
ncbi:MAG TPA: hypothetical protein VGE34_03475 [Candidatus Saccharimonadales bacterium]